MKPFFAADGAIHLELGVSCSAESVVFLPQDRVAVIHDDEDNIVIVLVLVVLRGVLPLARCVHMNLSVSINTVNVKISALINPFHGTALIPRAWHLGHASLVVARKLGKDT